MSSQFSALSSSRLTSSKVCASSCWSSASGGVGSSSGRGTGCVRLFRLGLCMFFVLLMTKIISMKLDKYLMLKNLVTRHGERAGVRSERERERERGV